MIFASVPLGSANRAMRDSLGGCRYPFVLVSYAYALHSPWETVLGYQPDFRFVDSGAFTAWTQGKDVDLDGYAEWALASRANWAASLDVIPGRPGGRLAGGEIVHPTAGEVEDATQRSLANGDRLRAAGLKIVEVYHQFEPTAHLDLLLERRQPGELLAIAPRNEESEKSRSRFLDATFGYLRDRCGWDDLPPCHGFAVTGRRLMVRYPWFSLDSSSWMAPGRYSNATGRGGDKLGRDSRVSRNMTLQTIHYVRWLEKWSRQGETLTRLWQERGVRYAA